MRSIYFMFLTEWLWSALLFAGDPLLSPCLMQPAYLSIRFPDSGFVWLGGGEFSGACEDLPTEIWSRKSSGTLDLFVHTDGPEGSGRFWNVIVGVADSKHSKPYRGVCLSTSTVGWCTLQQYSKGALSWLDDVDHDGNAEFILWDSFPLHEDASIVEYGLVAWTYRLVSNDSLVIDWDLSRILARSLTKEYYSQLETASGYRRVLIAKAAEALERFADGQSTVPHTETR
jgi:hypothetical protein